MNIELLKSLIRRGKNIVSHPLDSDRRVWVFDVCDTTEFRNQGVMRINI